MDQRRTSRSVAGTIARHVRASGGAMLLHVGIAAAATFPLVLTPLTRLIGHGDVDVWNHAWGPWWFWTCLSRGRVPFATDLLAYPDGGVLWYIDPLGALLGAPLVPLLGAVGAYNAVILAAVIFASVAARRLARVLGAAEPASWIASAVLCFSPYLLSEIHNGVSEAVGVGWALIALAAGLRALAADGRKRHFALAGMLLGVTAVGTWYYGLGATILLGAWYVPWLLRPPLGRKLARVALLGACAAPIALLTAGALLYSLDAEHTIVQRGAAGVPVKDMLQAHNAVDPRTFLWPLGFQSVDLASRGEAFLHSSYLGWLALGLAIYSRHWLLLAGVGLLAVIGLGPYLWWGDHWVTFGADERIPLPFQLFAKLLPTSGATHAQRIAMPAVAAVAAIAAMGASHLRPRTQRLLVFLVIVDAIVLGGSPWPVARAPRLDVEAHRAIAAIAVDRQGDQPSAVLDLPGAVGDTMTTSRYLTYQTVHGLPIPYRPDARGSTSSLLGLSSFQYLCLFSAHRPEHRARLTTELSRVPGLDSGELPRAGVRWVVVHRELERGTQSVDLTEQQLRKWFGEPTVYGNHAVYDTMSGNDANRPPQPPTDADPPPDPTLPSAPTGDPM